MRITSISPRGLVSFSDMFQDFALSFGEVRATQPIFTGEFSRVGNQTIDLQTLTSEVLVSGTRYAVAIQQVINGARSGQAQEISFVFGQPWPTTPARASGGWLQQIWNQLQKHWWTLAVFTIVGVLLLYLVYAFNNWANKSDGPKTAVASSTPPSVKLVDTIAETKGNASVPTTVSPKISRSGDLMITNALKATASGGAVIMATGDPNNIIIAGRDVRVDGNGGRRTWPAGIKPTRNDRIKPNESIPVGSKLDQIYMIQPGEDVVFILPAPNWRIQTFPDRDFRSDEYDSATDDNAERSMGELETGRTIRYRNKTDRPMQLGVRCIKQGESTNTFNWPEDK